MTIRQEIKSLNEALHGETLTELVKERFNCAEAEVDEHGEIWIANPMTGHWLNEDGLVEFMAWIADRDLDAAQDAFDPDWAERKRAAYRKIAG